MRLFAVCLNGSVYHIQAVSSISALLLTIAGNLDSLKGSVGLFATVETALSGARCSQQDCLYCENEPPVRDASGRFKR